MCPRAIKHRIQMDPDALLPVLPDPRDLKPFPSTKSVDFTIDEAEAVVTCMAVDPTGQWLASASTDKKCRLWEVETGRCLYSWALPSAPSAIAWNPSRALPCFALGVASELSVILPPCLPGYQAALEALSAHTPKPESKLAWRVSLEDPTGIVFRIAHGHAVSQVRWHRRGDYLASLSPGAVTTDAKHREAIAMHQLSTRQSQWPFARMPGTPLAIAFHPGAAPHFAMATAKAVRIYDLVGQALVKKMSPGLGGIGLAPALDMHPSGDHLLVGSFDGRSLWFDLDASAKPYRALQSHTRAVTAVAYHPGAHPLFASASADGTVQIVHGQVYQDLMQDPTIVPVKILRGFPGPVAQAAFHPIQPWLFVASAATITLFVSQ
jgi:ribosome biogenesis protein ERB1